MPCLFLIPLKLMIYQFLKLLIYVRKLTARFKRHIEYERSMSSEISGSQGVRYEDDISGTLRREVW